jgi:Zn-dependent protease with chaperone function
MQSIAIAILAVVFIVLSPVIIPVAGLLHRAHVRRMEVAADRYVCLACGGILGREALRRADAEWAEHMRQSQDQSLRLWRVGGRRMVRNVDAICPSCGARYKFDDRARTFGRVP